MDTAPLIVWFQRDLRLTDHAALHAAAGAGRPVLPAFILDDAAESPGSAPRFRLMLALRELDRSLRAAGSRLVLRRGPSVEVLQALAAETGARDVWWIGRPDGTLRGRDEDVAARLGRQGVGTRVFEGGFLFPPDEVSTQGGSPFRVFAAFWRAVGGRDPGAPLPPPGRIPAPASWPPSDALEDWHLDRPMRRGAGVVARFQHPGEAAARERLGSFLDRRLARYPDARNSLGEEGNSGLSEHLALGELSPRSCWVPVTRAWAEGVPGAEAFLRELAWREFAQHLLWHWPALPERNWQPNWDRFPWRREEDGPEVLAWKQGRTGIPIVDAAMREMYVTGRMHNRARMIAASFLTKHLLADWRIGLRWFEDCLTDWDRAANAMNWQWVAGSGPDAAPFFRIFNPHSQATTFDPGGRYLRTWLAEGQAGPPPTALAFYEAIPVSWRLRPGDAPPRPVVDLAQGRAAALEAFAAWRTARR